MVVGENNVVKRCVTLPLKGETEASLEGCERTGKHPVNFPQKFSRRTLPTVPAKLLQRLHQHGALLRGNNRQEKFVFRQSIA